MAIMLEAGHLLTLMEAEAGAILTYVRAARTGTAVVVKTDLHASLDWMRKLVEHFEAPKTSPTILTRPSTADAAAPPPAEPLAPAVATAQVVGQDEPVPAAPAA